MSATYNIVLDANSDFAVYLQFKNCNGEIVDFSTCNLRMQLRTRANSPTVLDELSTDNGRLSFEDDGKVRVFFPHDITRDYKFTHAVYDILAEDSNGFFTRILEGNVEARPEVTR